MNNGKKIVGINYKIPAPKTGNRMEAYGSWEGFVKEMRESIGDEGTLKKSEFFIDKKKNSDNL